mgnify:CR=1 FL=1
MVKNKFIKSVVSVLLSASIVFACSFVSQVLMVSAEVDAKTFNFDETVKNGNDIGNSAFTISADENHGTGTGKSLKIERTAVTTRDTNMGMLLTTKGKLDGEKYQVEWGKTYKVTLWYKTVGTAPSDSWMLGVSTGPIAFSGSRTAQSVSNPLMLPTTGSDWTKYETTFKATGSGTNTYLGLNVCFPAFDAYSGNYAVYIDDVTVESTDTAIAQSSTKTFDFGLIQDNISGYANSAFSGSTEQYRGAAANGKSIKIYKDAVASAGKMRSMLTLKDKSDSNFVYNVEWGKTYKVTLYYKTVGTFKNDKAWSLGIATGKLDGFISGSTDQTLDNSLDFPKQATDWTKLETTFTAIESDSKKQGNTCLGIAVNFPVFSDNTGTDAYAVYIDDVTVEEVKLPSLTAKTFGFEDTTLSSGDNNSAFKITDEAWHGTEASGKSMLIYKDSIASPGYHKALLTTEKRATGEQYNVEWGKTYKVTLYYKTVGAIDKAWSLGIFTGKKDGFVNGATEQTLNSSLNFPKEAADWTKFETTFTAIESDSKKQGNTCLGLGVSFPSFTGNTDYKVYIDDVTVEETEAPLPPPTPTPTTTKTFDFEKTQLDSGCANTAFSITDEAWHGTAASGKSVMVYKDAVASPGYMRFLLTTGKKNTGEQYNVEWGKTYKVTLYYKTVGTAVSTAWSLGLCTSNNLGFVNKPTNQTLNTRLYFPTKATDWTKFETTFTATESNPDNQERTYLGISVNFPSFTGNTDYKVYIDDVTVEETEPPIIVPTTEKVFDFESTELKSGMANSAFTVTGEEFHGDAAGGKSIKVYKDQITSAGYMKFLLSTGNQTAGERYNVEWGKTYKVTLWYKTVGTAPSEVWSLGICTGDNIGFVSKTTNQLNTPVYFETTATNGWIKQETTFTAVENNPDNQGRTCLGLSVNFPVFSSNADYALYIDDVAVEEIDNPVDPADSTTKTFDFETTVYDSGSANTAFTISGEQHHGSAKYGKSLRIYKDAIEKTGKMSALLTTGTKTTGEQYNIEWGKSYKVTLWYKTVGTLPGDTALKLRMYTNTALTFSNPYKLTEQSMNNSLSLPMTATDGWVKYEGIFTAFQPNKDYVDATCLGIGAEFPIYEGNTDYKVYIDDVTIEVVPDDQVPEKIIRQGFEDYNYLGYGYYYDRNFEIYDSSISGFDPKNVAEGSKSIHSKEKVKSRGLFSIMTDNYYIMESTGYYKLSFMVRADSVGAEGGAIKAVPLAVQSYTRTADEDFAVTLVDMSEIKDGRWYKVTQVVYAASYNYLGIQTPGSCSIYIDDIEMRKVDPSTVITSNERVVAMSARDGVLDNGNGSYPRTGEKFPYVVVEIGIVSAAVLLVSAKSLRRRKSK